MNTGSLGNVLAYFRRRVRSSMVTETPDGLLLERFAVGKDQAAFEDLLGRHGALVFGVCRRVLCNTQDAEDAFQATFLVLARQARHLDGRVSLAGWLYTVAYRVALKARTAAARRRDLELRRQAMAATPDADETVRREVRTVLDEELQRLPEKYRTPLVLCYLQGKTNEEAARLLGWTKGTISGRLARARDVLRGRLTRRGLALSAGTLGTVLAEEATAAAPPATLLETTARAASLAGAGQTLVGAVSAPVAELVQGTVKRLTLTRITRIAALLLVLGCVCGVVAAVVTHHLPTSLPPSSTNADGEKNLGQPQTRPAIVVQAIYPGANARTVADTVAKHIETALQGVENMQFITSQCGNDGSCLLTVTFRPGTNLDIAQVLVQNRVALAMPLLPEPVLREGLTVKKKSAGVLLFVAVSSSEDAPDAVQLSSVAIKQLVPELQRLEGVGEVFLVGDRQRALRIWMDPDKLAARQLTAVDVVRALQEQNVPLGALGAPKEPNFQLAIELPPGKSADPMQLKNTVVKTDDKGAIVYLKDVAEVVLQAPQSQARLNGRTVVVVAIGLLPAAKPAKVSAAVQKKVAALQGQLPKGVRVAVAFDFAANLAAGNGQATAEYLWLDAVLPDNASRERTESVLERCDGLLKAIPGVQDVLSMTGPPFAPASNQGCILVRLAPAGKDRASREQVVQAIRGVCHKIEEAVLRLRDLGEPGPFVLGGYPIDFAVHGPDDARVRALAAECVRRLDQSKKLTDVWTTPMSTPWLYVEINRDAVKARGVAIADIFTTLQVRLGSLYIQGDGKVLIAIYTAAERKKGKMQSDIESYITELKQLKVPDAKGKLVPLGELVTMREESTPLFVDRLDGLTMAAITANPASGVSLTEARQLCEKVFAEVRRDLGLPASYRLTWLGELPTEK
jgi:RNA polymerase sigma factor (sigma-70 family)